MSPVQVVQEWWATTTLKRLTMISVAFSSLIAAILAGLHFGEIAEPYWIATRQFTRELVQTAEKSTGGRLLSLEIASKETSRASTQGQIDRIETELAKIPATAPETLKPLMLEQLSRYKRRLELLNFELDDLRRTQSGRRP